MGGGFEGAEPTRRDFTESTNRSKYPHPNTKCIQKFTHSVKKMEKKFGASFTTIVTHINTTTTTFSLPLALTQISIVQTRLIICFFISLEYIRLSVSLFSSIPFRLPSIHNSYSLIPPFISICFRERSVGGFWLDLGFLCEIADKLAEDIVSCLNQP
ncbi:ABC transporter [Striga asiatica]|uniref:ABC transporter n=1 Tax=Striga asiatica TaxID=4170 RepID=A0A5A7QC77_STRAF|nr:ABC transporter [Striga asiatica]